MSRGKFEIIVIEDAVYKYPTTWANLKLTAKHIGDMCGMDLYEFKDCYDNLEEFITETAKCLWLSSHRKAIATALKEIVEWHDDDETASEASMLYREVMSL